LEKKPRIDFHQKMKGIRFDLIFRVGKKWKKIKLSISKMQFQSEMEQNFVEENSTAEDLSDFCLLKENIKFFS
jgi:hypothetical protein